MLLRNGKIYNPNVKEYIKKKRKFTKNCFICFSDYKIGDYITYCDKKNISKHSFHIECLLLVKKYNNCLLHCPYCSQRLEKPIKKYKFHYSV